jgi:glycosyltransferase involved in cell wall biosynthesis
VVVDGASVDNTEEVVTSWQAKFSGLKYFRLERRGGIDHDLARSIELALENTVGFSAATTSCARMRWSAPPLVTSIA